LSCDHFNKSHSAEGKIAPTVLILPHEAKQPLPCMWALRNCSTPNFPSIANLELQAGAVVSAAQGWQLQWPVTSSRIILSS